MFYLLLAVIISYGTIIFWFILSTIINKNKELEN